MEFTTKKCRICNELRRFVIGNDREQQSICGECWIWQPDNIPIRTKTDMREVKPIDEPLFNKKKGNPKALSVPGYWDNTFK